MPFKIIPKSKVVVSFFRIFTVFTLIIFSLSIASKAQNTEYYKTKKIAYGISYFNFMSSITGQWRNIYGSTTEYQKYMFKNASGAYANFVLDLKKEKLFLDFGLGVMNRKGDYEIIYTYSNSVFYNQVSQINGSFYTGFKYKIKMLNFGVNLIMERNLHVITKENGVASNNVFYPDSKYYFGLRPEIGFEQKLMKDFSMRINLFADYVNTGLTSFGINLILLKSKYVN